MKRDIQNRDDVFSLVSTFYDKIRSHELLGPIFNEVIKNWPEHLEKLTDFWETNLFMVRKFNGNPMTAHVEVDKKFDNSIEPLHFGEWLNLWFATIDDLFEGERANTAKNRARRMSTHLFLNIFQNRPKK
jgi:hemoglobin